MAAALDQYPTKVLAAEVVSAKGNPSADLMAAWLQCRLGVPVEHKNSRGPGITAVRMFTASGPIALTRPDGSVATFTIPGAPDRPVALKRRTPSELLSEELRRLDPDDVYAKTLACMVEREKMPASAKTVSDADRRSTQAAVSKAAAKTAGVTGRAASAELAAHADGKKASPAKKAAVAKNAAARKPGVPKATAKKTAAKRTAKSSSAARSTGSRSTAKKAAAGKSTAKKAPAKKTASKRVAGRS